jgi:hypothetical protein
MAYFPPIYTSKLVSPSFFDAPAAADSLLPDGDVFKNLPEGDVLPSVSAYVVESSKCAESVHIQHFCIIFL